MKLPPPIGWATHHDEPMMFPKRSEAAAFCADDEQPIPLCDRAAVLDAVAALIANDAYVISFQTMGQYRTALLTEIRNAAQDARKE